MKFRNKIGWGMLAALLALVGVGVGVVCMLGNYATTVVADEESAQQNGTPIETVVVNGAEFAVNKNGQTYGAPIDTDGDNCYDTFPDLSAVKASNGKLGYAYTDELNSLNSIDGLSLEQVLAGERTGASSINVYEADGETVIGTFGEMPDGAVLVHNVDGDTVVSD